MTNRNNRSNSNSSRILLSRNNLTLKCPPCLFSLRQTLKRTPLKWNSWRDWSALNRFGSMRSFTRNRQCKRTFTSSNSPRWNGKSRSAMKSFCANNRWLNSWSKRASKNSNDKAKLTVWHNSWNNSRFSSRLIKTRRRLRTQNRQKCAENMPFKLNGIFSKRKKIWRRNINELNAKDRFKCKNRS